MINVFALLNKVIASQIMRLKGFVRKLLKIYCS